MTSSNERNMYYEYNMSSDHVYDQRNLIKLVLL